MARGLAIVGAGGTGLTLAAEWTLAGHAVTLADMPDRRHCLREVGEAGVIRLDRPAREGGPCPVPAPRLTEDAARAVTGADLVVFTCVAQRQEELAAWCLPWLRDGQAVLFAPGNAGSLVMRRLLAGLAAGRRPRLLLGEMEGNWFPCRRVGPAAVYRALPLAPHFVAALPAVDTPALIECLRGLLEARAGTNVLEAALNSPNVVIHLAASLLNLGAVERAGAGFCLFRDGLTPAVFRVLAAVDAEKNALFARLGWTARSPLGLLEAVMAGRDTGLSPELARFVSLSGPDGAEHRYLSEDAWCGVSLLASLGRLCDLPMPAVSSVLRLAGLIHGRDYERTGRSPANLGLDAATPEDLNRLLQGKE